MSALRGTRQKAEAESEPAETSEEESTVDLDAGKAVVSGKTLPEDAVLTAAVTEAGYEVVDIK